MAPPLNAARCPFRAIFSASSGDSASPELSRSVPFVGGAVGSLSLESRPSACVIFTSSNSRSVSNASMSFFSAPGAPLEEELEVEDAIVSLLCANAMDGIDPP